MSLSFNEKRIGAGILLLATLVCVANYYLEWMIFGRFNKEVMIATFVLMFFYQRLIGPTLEELQEYRSNRKARSGQVAEASRGLRYVLVIAGVMLVAVILGPVSKLGSGESLQRDDWIQLIVIESLIVVAGIFGWVQLRKFQGRNSTKE